jgi:hypothetical protein
VVFSIYPIHNPGVEGSSPSFPTKTPLSKDWGVFFYCIWHTFGTVELHTKLLPHHIQRYEAIFAIYLQMMKRDEYAKVHYVCPDASFALRLFRMFELIKPVSVTEERVPITEKHRARYTVYALDN